MNKNQSNIYQFVLRDMIGQGVTGLSPTVRIRKDTDSFTATTNTPTEVGYGLYEVALTAAECNCDIMAIEVSLPDGQFPAILTNEYLTTTGGATPAEIWQYNGQGGRTVTNTIPTASDNAQAVWGAQNKEVTIATAQADTFATESALTTVGNNVTAIKAKTDNLPAEPAAKSDIPSVQSIQSGLATSDALSAVGTNVSAVKAKTDNLPASPAAVGSEMALTSAAVSAVQSGLATGTNVSNAQTAIINRGNEAWKTADVAGALLLYGAAKTSDVPTAEAIWSYPDRELTSEIVIGISTQNIKDITDSVWDAPDRTLTDLKPKPNGKNIVCTPTNVTNAYGVPRLENWTNETSGTTAFDEKIETYITLAKEKMATDLNDHINAAIDYIGADNITELCAWLTGYNLYKDDESTDTDSLPETRYNQYLEQIHRIMENI